MSYPKQHPTKGKTTHDQVKFHKREQLKNIIINKFRGKFGVRAEVDQADAIIKREVDTLLATEQPTEANLVKLDKKLSKMLGTAGRSEQEKRSERGSKPASTMGMDDRQAEPVPVSSQSKRSVASHAS